VDLRRTYPQGDGVAGLGGALIGKNITMTAAAASGGGVAKRSWRRLRELLRAALIRGLAA